MTRHLKYIRLQTCIIHNSLHFFYNPRTLPLILFTDLFVYYFFCFLDWLFCLICCIVVSIFNHFIRCQEPQWDDFDCSAAGLNEETCMLAMKNASIPANYTSDHQLVFEQCMKYNVSGEAFDPNIDPFHDPGWPTSQVIECDSGWVYDKSQYQSSIIADVSYFDP